MAIIIKISSIAAVNIRITSRDTQAHLDSLIWQQFKAWLGLLTFSSTQKTCRIWTGQNCKVSLCN
jgi:hypothetical protein